MVKAVPLFDAMLDHGPEPAALMELASRQVHLTDFGDPRLGPPLEAALRAFRQEAWPAMSEPYRRMALGYLRDFLTSRLQVVADRKRHPAIARVEIRKPLIIVGPSRSGSSRLHTLLSLDPANIAPTHWVCIEPSPPPGLGEGARHRIARAEMRMKGFFDQLPGVTHAYMHEEGAHALAECGSDIMSMAMTSQAMWAYFPIPSYREYLWSGDHRGALGFHRDFLQHVQWGGGASRWALKGSDHLTWLAELSAQYPDATFIWTHRELGQLLGSQIKVIGVLRGRGQPLGGAERRRLASEMVDHQQKLLERGLRAREIIGEARFIDLSYDDIMTDPLRSVGRIYEHLGQTLSAGAAENIREWVRRNPPSTRRTPKSSPAEFGLQADVINRRFAEYRERFGFGFGICRSTLL
jgi:hypothetical protein